MYYSPLGTSDLPTDVCFYHNGQLIQDGSCGGCNLVGINELYNLIQAKIYPNPASDEIFIDSGPSNGPFVFRIFNTIGELIYLDKVFPGNTNIYTGPLGLSGLLHIVLTDKNGQTQIGNVLVY